jgi:hypothetical protein
MEPEAKKKKYRSPQEEELSLSEFNDGVFEPGCEMEIKKVVVKVCLCTTRFCWRN